MRLIIDSSNLCYSAFYTTGQLEYQGKPTGIIFGYLRKLFTIIKDLKPESIIFTWDSKKSLRKQFFPDYKKKRHENKTPEEIQELYEAFSQFTEIRETVLPLLGWKNSFMVPGYEADDIIAYVVQRYPDNYFIVSSDHDLYQLLYKDWAHETKIYAPNTAKIMDYDTFYMVYGIKPDKWAMAKAIGGCDTDNVPGIEGIGDPGKSVSSGAIRYLRGNLKPESKIFQKIESEEGKAIIDRNYRLVALPFDSDFDLDLTEDHLLFSGFNQVIRQYGFNSFKIADLMDYLPIRND